MNQMQALNILAEPKDNPGSNMNIDAKAISHREDDHAMSGIININGERKYQVSKWFYYF